MWWYWINLLSHVYGVVIKTVYNCFAMVIIKHLTLSAKSAEGVSRPNPGVSGSSYWNY